MAGGAGGAVVGEGGGVRRAWLVGTGTTGSEIGPDRQFYGAVFVDARGRIAYHGGNRVSSESESGDS